MAFVNIHSLSGVTVALSYFSGETPVGSPTPLLDFSAGVYSLPSAATNWDKVTFEVTSFGTGVLPVTGRISVVDAYVVGPYSGVVAIASGTTYGDTIAQTTVSPDANRTVNCSAGMSLTNRYFMFGHNASGAGDIQNLASLILEMDGDFPIPDFWQDFEGTIEDVTLTKTPGLIYVPEQLGNPALPERTYCLPDPPPPPGPGCGTCVNPVTGNCYPCPSGGGGGGGSDPPEGSRPPPDTLLCWPVPGGTCCRYPGVGVICETI